MELPLYELQISDEEDSALEVDYVALVNSPAIQKNFLAFNEQRHHFAIDNERRIISGPAMIPDIAMFRTGNGNIPDHKVFFSKETIYQIAQKFFMKGFNKNFNIMHDPEMKADDVFVFESFITDSERGIKPMKGFEDTPDGTWFLSAKVDNDDVWGKVKSGDLKGLSVEGLFKYKKPKLSEDQAYEKIKQILNEIN